MSNITLENQSIDNEQTGILITIPKDFNENKNKIKAFSENFPKEIDLPIVPNSGGLFGWFDYSVTGNDLNRLTESIQDKMIEQNKVLVSMIQEFNTIYKAFSALDKDFLQRFLLSLKAAEEANAKALKGIEGVKENQKEIKQIISQQKQVIQVLKNFKEKIETIEHLADVDVIFANLPTIQSNIRNIEAEVTNSRTDFENNIKKLNDGINKQKEAIHVLHDFKEKIETIEHLADVDKIFADLFSLQSTLKTIETEVTNNKTDIENNTKKVNEEIKQQTESIYAYLKSELLSTQDEITDLRSLTGTLSKELKTTRIISFASIAITLVLVILIITGVL